MTKITLNINEIARVKTGETTLDDAVKTHDGTSMGKLKGWINNFSIEYGEEETRIVQVVGKDGKGLLVGTYSDKENNLTPRMKYSDLEGTDNHLMKNPDYNSEDYGFYHDAEDGAFTPMAENDMLDLLRKNKDGDYLFQSTSLVSPNYKHMTLLRNNKFSKENEASFKKIAREFDNDVKKSEWSRKADKVYLKLQKDNPDVPVSELDKMLEKEMRSETGYGTMFEYLKSRGYEDKFEECNVRFVMRNK